MIRKTDYLIAALLTLLLANGCKDDTADQFETDQRLIEAYVADQNLAGEYLEEGVFVSFETEGSGTETPDLTSTLEIIYRGYLLDGTEFDNSRGFPATLSLSRVIQGWQLALPLFTRDSKGTVIIPSRYGYGPRATGNIPANSVLVFDIELIDFQ
jgi:FKBP-type peptidyl-prolyl cis-trans isomerase